MVVIALIGVLAGILLVAVGGATDSAKKARTKATLESVGAAMDAFALEHGTLPGIVPMRCLGDGSKLTATQNIMLHLTGGARVSPRDMDETPLDPAAEAEYQRYLAEGQANDMLEPLDIWVGDPDRDMHYHIAIRIPQIGAGPFINGRQYAPYISLKDDEMVRQWVMTGDEDPGSHQGSIEGGYNQLPDFVDAWGQPIIIMRRDRKGGPVIAESDDTTSLPQFELAGIDRYLNAVRLGDLEMRQTNGLADQFQGSRLTGGSNIQGERDYWMFLVLSTPAMRFDIDSDPPYNGTSRAGYALMSAGPDGVFLARADGPLNDTTGAPDLDVNPDSEGRDHQRLKDFDDVIMYGGS